MSARDAQRLFQLLEFKFVQGTGGWTGTISDELAVVEFSGPEADISEASVTITVPKPPTKEQADRTVVYLGTLLTVAAPDWGDGSAWLSANLGNIGESRAVADGREIVLTVTLGEEQTVCELTVSASGRAGD